MHRRARTVAASSTHVFPLSGRKKRQDRIKFSDGDRYAAPQERSPLGTERLVVSGDNFVGAVACSLISCPAVQDDQRKHELWR